MHWTYQIRHDAAKELHQAISSGDVPRISSDMRCVDCGGEATSYDHRSYFRPLDVEPVCHSCNNFRGQGEPPLQGRGPNGLLAVPTDAGISIGDAINYYGSITALAAASQVSRMTLHKMKNENLVFPLKAACLLHLATDGDLCMNFEDYGYTAVAPNKVNL